jgi:glucokinase
MQAPDKEVLAAMQDLVVADIGGTHARFALARIGPGGVAEVSEPVTLKTAAYAGIGDAWRAFAGMVDRPLPRSASIALAGPVGGDELRLTNNPWVMRSSTLADELGLEELVILNDFGAVAHAVACLEPSHFLPVCGSANRRPAEGVISVLGPGTGLGVAMLITAAGHDPIVIETEGGHIDFAPRDSIDDALLQVLRRQHGRVSVERVVSGPALNVVRQLLADRLGASVAALADDALWRLALAGGDELADAALERFLANLGAVAGDIALAQGAGAVVIAGGLGRRLADRLPASTAFGEAFKAKGRFSSRMAAMPVMLLAHPEPGLFGAAAAFSIGRR